MKYIPKYQNPYQPLVGGLLPNEGTVKKEFAHIEPIKPLVPFYRSFQEADANLNQTAYNSITGDRQTYKGGQLSGPVISAANTPEGYRSDISSLREDLLNTSPTLHSQVPRKYDKYKISDRLSTNAPAVDPATRGLINIAQGVAELPQWVAPLPFLNPAIKGSKVLSKSLGKFGRSVKDGTLLTRLDNSIPASIDKLIKPRMKINFSMDDLYTGNFLKNKTMIGDGMENIVYSNGKGKVFKVRAPGNPTSDIKGIKLTNNTMLDMDGPKTTIAGYFKHPRSNNLQPILKQDYIEGVYPTTEEVAAFAKQKGMVPTGLNSYRFGTKYISDFHNENLLKDSNGRIYPFDFYTSNKKPL